MKLYILIYKVYEIIIVHPLRNENKSNVIYVLSSLKWYRSISLAPLGTTKFYFAYLLGVSWSKYYLHSLGCYYIIFPPPLGQCLVHGRITF